MTTGITENNGNATESIRTGQRLIIFALLCNVIGISRNYLIAGLFYAFGHQLDLVFSVIMVGCGICSLASIALGVVGMLRLSRGMGYHWAWRVLYCILLFLPLISITVLAILNSKANAHLKSAGYRVGFWGALPKTDLSC